VYAESNIYARIAAGNKYEVAILLKVPRVSQGAGRRVQKFAGLYKSILTAVCFVHCSNDSSVEPRFGTMSSPHVQDGSRPSERAAWVPQDDFVVDMTGARVTAALIRRAEAISQNFQHAVEAAPFTTLQMKHVFSSLGRLPHAPRIEEEFLKAYLKLREHNMSIGGVRNKKDARCICPVRPLIPDAMRGLDRYSEQNGVDLGWEPDFSLSDAVIQSMLQLENNSSLQDSGSRTMQEALVLKLSAGMHGYVVTSRHGVNVQLPSMQMIQGPLRDCRMITEKCIGASNVEYVGSSAARKLVNQVHRLLEVEGLAMLEVRCYQVLSSCTKEFVVTKAL
jgi:hypothetical protein